MYAVKNLYNKSASLFQDHSSCVQSVSNKDYPAPLLCFLWFRRRLQAFGTSVVDDLHQRFTVHPPQSRSAPGQSAPRPPQVRSFRPRFTVNPPQVLGRSAPTELSRFILAMFWTDVWTFMTGQPASLKVVLQLHIKINHNTPNKLKSTFCLWPTIISLTVLIF